MKKTLLHITSGKDDMRPEYDFSSMKGAVGGKYAKAYRAGHKVVIHNEDGTTSVKVCSLTGRSILTKGEPIS